MTVYNDRKHLVRDAVAHCGRFGITGTIRLLPLLFRRRPLPHWAKTLERKRERGDLKGAFGTAARAARAGDVDAQFTVAKMYLKGEGAPPNFGSAALWFERSAQSGQPFAMVEFAKLLIAGHRPNSSLFLNAPRISAVAARRWAEEAATAGLPEGKSLLALLLGETGESKTPVGGRRLALLGEAAEGNDPSACLQLAIHSRHHDPDGDPEVVTSLIRRAANGGLPMATYLLGVAADIGFGCRRNHAEAVAHYGRAAEFGITFAQTRYGAALLVGAHVKANVIVAETWLRKAALKGDGNRARLMTDFRAGQDGLPADFPDAFRWAARAAELGEATAARVVALFHLLGLGVPENSQAAAAWICHAETLSGSSLRDPAALLAPGGIDLPVRMSPRKWFEAAARSGNRLAAYRLGVTLAFATGRDIDYLAGARWLLEAIPEIPAARLRYGQLLMAGRGIPADTTCGLAMIKEAAKAGVAEAQSVMARLTAGKARAGESERPD